MSAATAWGQMISRCYAILAAYITQTESAIAERQRALGEPVAFLHTVTQDDGESDQALSFSRDSFPFAGVGGFRSVECVPLFTHPPLSMGRRND